MSIVKNLIRKKTNQTNKRPIAFCCFYDGAFDSQLAETGINLIGCKNMSLHQFADSSLSHNIKLIHESEINNYQYDFIIYNDLVAQEKYIDNFSRMMHVPGLVIDHGNFRETAYHLNMRLSRANVDLVSMAEIGYGTEEIKGVKKDIPILLEGNFTEQDYNAIRSIKNLVPELTVIGYNPGLECSTIPQSYMEYRDYFARCETLVYFPSNVGISQKVLWALSNNSMVMTIKTPSIEKIINRDNGIVYNNISEIMQNIKRYKSEKAKHKGNKDEINSQFSLANFESAWRNITEQYVNKVFKYG
jgi:hypothetical protein